MKAAIVAGALILAFAQNPAWAEGGTATEMWGAVDSGTGTNSMQSALMHQASGIVAGQVNAALKGVLYSGPNMTVVGSQTIVQVSGNNNVVTEITQDAVNSGNQSLDAPIN